MVFLHSLGLDRSMWDDVVRRLVGDVPTMVCDLPGHGASPLGDVTSVEEMAAAVAGHLRARAFAPAIILGQSLGGFVGQTLAARHPDVVTGLVLIATTAWYGEGALVRWEERARKAELEGLGTLPEFQRDRWFSPGFQQRHPGTVDRLLSILPTNSVESYAAGCRMIGAFDGRELLDDIRVPVSVIVGEHDAATPPEVARSLADGLSDARLRVLTGRRHLGTVEEPDAVVEELHGLFARLQPAVPGVTDPSTRRRQVRRPR